MGSTLKEELPKIQECLCEWYDGIIFPIKDLAEVIKKRIQKDPEFRSEIEQQTWSDTFVREDIMDMIAKHFIDGMYWPMSSDDGELKNIFQEKLEKVMKTRGWKFKKE